MSQEEILETIKANPGIRQVEITKQHGHNSKMIQALLRKNLIRREYSPKIQGFFLWSKI